MLDTFNQMICVKPSISMRYEPERWNGDDVVRKSNCLGYALNSPDVGSPFLGSLKYSRDQYKTTQKRLSELFNNYFKKHGFAAVSKLRMDFVGLKRIRKHELNPSKFHIMGFSTYCGHFLRLDENRVWSHKPGEDPVRNYDDRGNAILDLDIAEWEEYDKTQDETVYVTIPESGIKVHPLF